MSVSDVRVRERKALVLAPETAQPAKTAVPSLLLGVLAGILAAGLRLAILPLLPIPVPTTHDEFSYLLGADTFASGRITNPPHRMWVHFETLHVNQQPTYCSIYPPAQALFLGLGERLFGHPWFGVCLSVAVMFAALCWMLQGWMSLKCALQTTILGILGWGLTGPWINSYWGGAVAAAGGALVLGAIPRLVRTPSATAAALGSAGLMLLANSRPYEGVMTACAAAGVLGWWMHREKKPLRSLLRGRTLVTFLAITASAGVVMGYYNYRTTGNILVHPYQLNQKIYASTQALYVLPQLPPKMYRHENLRKYWMDWARPQYSAARANPLSVVPSFGAIMGRFYLLNPFTLVFLLGLILARRWEIRAALMIAAAPAAGLMLSSGVQPHYLAPVFGAFLIIGAAALERIGQWKSGGVILIGGLVGFSLGWCGLAIQYETQQARKAPVGIATRPLLIQQLEREGGKHLVIVRYGPKHFIHNAEWIYNQADIDRSDIVWAQDMGAARNQELLDYYRGRKVWLLEPDTAPLAVTHYTGQL